MAKYLVTVTIRTHHEYDDNEILSEVEKALTGMGLPDSITKVEDVLDISGIEEEA